MHKQCAHCQLTYEKEPGFYYGALYVSYGLTIAFSVALFIAYLLFFRHFDILYFILTDVIGILALFPIFLRLSRAIWLNLFEHFQTSFNKQMPQ